MIEVTGTGWYGADRSMAVSGLDAAAREFEELTGVPLAEVAFDLELEGRTWNEDDSGRVVLCGRVGVAA